MAKTYNTRIKCKYDTKSHWEASTLILLEGEIAVAQDGTDFRVKIGDGTKTYSQLPYVTNYTISDTSAGDFVTGATLNSNTGVITIARGSIGVSEDGDGNVVTSLEKTTSNGNVTITFNKDFTAVADDDERLSDARTPLAHASTHGANGSDPIQIAESQVTNLTDDLAAKYVKPSGGIPKSDLATAVQTSLGKADTAVQPSALNSYVLKSAAGNGEVYAKASDGTLEGVPYSSSSTGGTLALRDADGQIKVKGTPEDANDAASKQYVDSKVSGAVEYLGTAADKATVLAAADAGKGDFFRASAQFTINGQTAYSGDLIIAKSDGAGSLETNWDVIHAGEVITPNDGTLTMNTAGGNLSGSATFSADSADNKTFTVTHTGPGTGSKITPTAGSGRTYITEVDADANGHITGVKTATETAVSANNSTITLSAGGGLSGGGDFTLNQNTAETITFTHGAKPSSGTAATSSEGSGSTFVTEVDIDTYGHVSGVKRVNYNPPSYSLFTRTTEGLVAPSGERSQGGNAKLLADDGVWVEDLILDCGSSTVNTFNKTSISIKYGSLESQYTYEGLRFKFGDSTTEYTYSQVEGNTYEVGKFYIKGTGEAVELVLSFDNRSESVTTLGSSYTQIDLSGAETLIDIKPNK